MPFLESSHVRAQLLIALLGFGLLWAMWPYLTGLVGAIVLFVIFGPLYQSAHRRIHPTLAAAATSGLALFLIVVPGLSVAGLVVNEAQQVAGSLVRSPVFSSLAELRIREIEVGPHLMNLGENVVSWIGQSAFSLIDTATNLALNITIAIFGLYFLLIGSGRAWNATAPYIPFSPTNTERLKKRFRDVTTSTLLGTGLTAIVQGVLVGAAFAIAGLPSAFFWGVVTAVLSILPVVGSGLIWGPGAIALLLNGRYVAAVGILVWGLLVVASVDNVIRPIVYRKWAKIHPVVTLVGALAGIRFFGILGLLIGPLALSYFFLLISMYKEEYIEDATLEAGEAVAR